LSLEPFVTGVSCETRGLKGDVRAAKGFFSDS
jgi:hypothetical protein